jgi:hypothetical protein
MPLLDRVGTLRFAHPTSIGKAGSAPGHRLLREENGDILFALCRDIDVPKLMAVCFSSP